MAVPHRAGKLAVILHADVAGSTSLVQQDEHLAHERIRTTFRRFGDTITRYHGRVRELRGDALLAEFERASDAVAASLAFQADQAEHNTQVEDDIRPTVRVGIAMGEVIFADRTVTGAGVVLAQRMEQLAKPGGICITAAIHESLPQRMPFDQRNLGEQEVKGFDEPVRAYTVRLNQGVEPPAPAQLFRGGRARLVRGVVTAAVVAVVCAGGLLAWYRPWSPDVEPVSPESMALPLPDKPSIVVLPFDNLSAEGSDPYLADAITETLIATLGRVPELFVIARNSAFAYKGQALDVRQISQELGVRHVLEGSVQKSEDQIRVTAQLIDATTGQHLWAERYDRPLDDFFALQDEIALKVLVSLQGKLTEGGDAALRSSSTDNVQAYVRFQEALNAFFKRTKDDQIETRRLADEALALDPRFAAPRQLKAWTHIIDVLYGYSESPQASLAAAEAEINRIGAFEDEAISIIAEGEASMVRAWGALLRRQYDAALEHGRKTVELIPNHADMLASYGAILLTVGQPEDAVQTLRRAMRLSPQYQSWQARVLSEALTLSGDHDAAVSAGKDTIDRAEGDYNRARGYMVLAVAYADAGRVDLARDQVDRALELAPDMTIDRARQFYKLYRNESDAERFLEALRAAGLPE